MRFDEAWAARGSMDFIDWVIVLSESFENSAYSLQRAAGIAGVHPAELFAYLKVATLEDEVMQEFARVMPPITSWLSICSSNTKGALAALSAIEEQKGQPGFSPWRTAETAIEVTTGGSIHAKLGAMPSALLSFAAKKAAKYDALTEKNRNALKNMATTKKSGKSLSVKQIGYIESLLRQLVKEEVISPQTKDGDLNECLEIIQLLEEP